jgi:H+/Cl- antiporter ClcA/PII-like signaling protein
MAMEFAGRSAPGADDSYDPVGGLVPEISLRRSLTEIWNLLVDLIRWIPISIVVGILAGTASALLLKSLEIATAVRDTHHWLILLLAPAGVLVGLMYRYLGRSVEAGNNLILDEVHDPQATIPIRMTPLILIGTFLTHLFGGSAGREGTAIQTGASLADQLTRPLHLGPRDRRILLMAGIAAGFGSVFGTPLSGAFFGIEVLAIGRLSYEALAPCFIASFVGNIVTHAWGIHHTVFTVTDVPNLNIGGIFSAMAAGACFGLAGMAFSKLTHRISGTLRHYIGNAPLRPAVGGILVTIAVFSLHTTKYIGLGIPTMVQSFDHRLPFYDWAGKLLFTAVTLGSGFKGGEVTPLFYIGSTLGNALSGILPLPTSLLAGMGFVAVFAGAANTPISSTLMACELFGPHVGYFAGIACVISYLFSGHSGIYHSQRIGSSKHRSMAADEGMSLGHVSKLRHDTDNESEEELLEAINHFGYIEGEYMEHLSVLRLYFSASEMRPADAWWKKLTPQSLGEHLLRQAKEHGIEQALLHRVIGGYLRNEDLAMDNGEIPPARLPQCLELVGEEEDLQSFLTHNEKHLTKVRRVFLRGEEARIEAAIERQELEEALEMEHAEGHHKPKAGEQ